MIDLAPHYLQIILQLIQQHVPQAEVWAFGSRVTWTAKDYSDLDLVLKAPQPLPSKRFFQFQNALEASDLPIKVDVLDWHQISTEFRKNIKTHYEVIYPSKQQDRGSGVKFDFPVVALGDLVKVKGGKRLPKGSNLQTEPNDHPYIRVRDMGQRFIPEIGLEYVPDEVFPKIQRYIVEENDVIISIVGTIGLISIIDERFHLASQTENCAKLSGLDRVDALYVYYYLSSNIGQQSIKKVTVGAVQAKLPLYNIEKIPVIWPERKERESIVGNLSALDNKIELNRQINQTLEQIAQAIFKSWFVDFDPVHAKQNGQPPIGMDAETAALFPSEFEDSELGEIPQGWGVMALDEIANYQNGLALQKFRPEDENDFLPVVKIAQLRKGSADGAEKASPYIKSECIIDNGDVVFSWSGSLMVDVWCGGRAALNQHLFKVISTEYPKWFYHFWTKHHLRVFQQIASDKAVTMGHIKRSHLKEAKCIVPNRELLKDNILDRFLSKQIEVRLECITLGEIRDALLPKLLSGEIQISNPQSTVETVA